jgi:hypothetical protein
MGRKASVALSGKVMMQVVRANGMNNGNDKEMAKSRFAFS